MNKKEFLLIMLMSVLFVNCYSQPNNIKLSDNIQLTYKDILELRLQILAAQMTSGCYTIMDMGGIDYPVSISINKQNKIIFKIEGNLKSQLSKEKQKEIMSEGFLFVKVGITELISVNFPKLKFNDSNDINGFWYYKDAHDPCAKWGNNTFEWINH
jgi:hypothetical protein